MNNTASQKQILNIIYRCLKLYDENLKNKKLLLIMRNDKMIIEKIELYFPKSSFAHLTGVTIMDNDNNALNSFSFYNLLKSGSLSVNKYKIECKDYTTGLKLQVLPYLMRIDKNANMVGDFDSSKIYLQTDKLIGGTNCCMGFIKEHRKGVYVPNTALNTDMRNIIISKCNILAILKKSAIDNLYKEITYLKKCMSLEEIFCTKQVLNIIDIQNLYSQNKNINSKINNYYLKSN